MPDVGFRGQLLLSEKHLSIIASTQAADVLRAVHLRAEVSSGTRAQARATRVSSLAEYSIQRLSRA